MLCLNLNPTTLESWLHAPRSLERLQDLVQPARMSTEAQGPDPGSSCAQSCTAEWGSQHLWDLLLHFPVFYHGHHRPELHMELSCVCLYTYPIKAVTGIPAASLWFPHATNQKDFLSSVLLVAIKAGQKINAQLMGRNYTHLI